MLDATPYWVVQDAKGRWRDERRETHLRVEPTLCEAVQRHVINAMPSPRALNDIIGGQQSPAISNSDATRQEVSSILNF